jgi:hypothetical protein
MNPLPLALLETVIASEHIGALRTGKNTHEPSLKLVAQLVQHSQDEVFITRIVASFLPPNYAGDSLDEIAGMVRDAIHSHYALLVFDNVSGMKWDMSDALCALSTGSGFSTRKYYTDDEARVCLTLPNYQYLPFQVGEAFKNARVPLSIAIDFWSPIVEP